MSTGSFIRTDTAISIRKELKKIEKIFFYQCPKGKGLLSIDVFDDDFFVFCSCCFSLVNFSIEDFINDPTRRSFRFCTTSFGLL
jgi:hypothetical protein